MENIEDYKIDIQKAHTVSIDLDTLKNWEFLHKGKVYKLNVKELLRLLELIKK